ncbi:MAG: DJ-1/PfpI family protein [Thermoanaerobaculia bacterium]
MRRCRTAAVATLLALVITACQPGTAREPSKDAGRASGNLEDLARTATDRKLRAGFLIVDGVYNTELTAPYDVLEHTLYHVPEDRGIEVFTVSPQGEPVTTAEGLRISADHSFESAPAIDILVVPSAEGSRDSDLEDTELIRWVADRGAGAGAIMSLCWGAFVLAEAGLLDRAACTTFPKDYRMFSERFPELDLRINVSFVHSGRAVTSQGGARSFDAAMYLVDALYGTDVATRIGSGLLIPWPPDDGALAYLSSTE